MPDETSLEIICRKCGKLFKRGQQGADDEKLYCSYCMVELAEQYVPEASEMPTLKRIRKSRAWTVIQWTILLVGISIITIQAPKLISVFKKDKPIRYGIYSTDAQTDQCIKNLWHISKLLQEGKLPGKDITCPAGNNPYMMRTIEGETVVRCPNPELHGFVEMRVSNKALVPEVRK